MAFIPHVRSAKNVTVYLDGQQHIVPAGTPQFDVVIDAIAKGDKEAIKAAVNMKQHVVDISNSKVTIENGVLSYMGYPLNNTLSDVIVKLFSARQPIDYLLMFLDNLMQNPDPRAVNELFDWIAAGSMTLTNDGHFLAYKKVRDDYTSVYDGKTRNDIGTVVEMIRSLVDPDKHRTCSQGLHFCSEGYLDNFGGNRVLILKINPADVVAIPADYNNTKGRAWRYEIIGEVGYDADGLVEKLTEGVDTKFSFLTVQTPDPTPAPIDDEGEEEPPQVATKNSSVTVKTGKVVANGTQKKPGQNSLTDSQVRDIRNMLDEGWTVVAIARAMGTSERTVARIRDGETYTHVK